MLLDYEIQEIAENYGMFKSLHDKYFMRFVKYKDGGTAYVYDESRAKAHAEFVATWPQKKEKIIARIKKGDYKFSGGSGRARDKKEIAEKDVRYAALTLYYELAEKLEGYTKLIPEGETIESFLASVSKSAPQESTETPPQKQ